jgi:long-chain acyl-CoA synthetase
VAEAASGPESEVHRDKLALVDPTGREWTRSELLASCNRVLGGLRDLGLVRGDAVAINSPNSAEFLKVALACTQAGW